MSDCKLSKAQQRVLIRALGETRISYYSGGDTTMNVLARLGFATWDNCIGQKYGKAHWWITDEGIAEARKII